MRKLILTVFTFFSLISAPAISYAEDVKIGVLYPLTGPVAQVGKDAVAAVKTALDIINNSHNNYRNRFWIEDWFNYNERCRGICFCYNR